jgi:hypothetical protein
MEEQEITPKLCAECFKPRGGKKKGDVQIEECSHDSDECEHWCHKVRQILPFANFFDVPS